MFNNNRIKILYNRVDDLLKGVFKLQDRSQSIEERLHATELILNGVLKELHNEVGLSETLRNKIEIVRQFSQHIQKPY